MPNPILPGNVSHLFHLISLLIPFFLMFLLAMISVFNGDLKVLFYLLGLIITIGVALIMSTMIKENVESLPNICNLYNGPFPFNMSGTSPALSSVIISFTATYLTIPMVYNNFTNWSLVATFMLLFAVDGYYKHIEQKCVTKTGIFIGLIIGIISGFLWYITIINTNRSFVYFDEFISDKLLCNRPTNQQFKCAVYKNGELIRHL